MESVWLNFSVTFHYMIKNMEITIKQPHIISKLTITTTIRLSRKIIPFKQKKMLDNHNNLSITTNNKAIKATFNYLLKLIRNRYIHQCQKTLMLSPKDTLIIIKLSIVAITLLTAVWWNRKMRMRNYQTLHFQITLIIMKNSEGYSLRTTHRWMRLTSARRLIMLN